MLGICDSLTREIWLSHVLSHRDLRTCIDVCVHGSHDPARCNATCMRLAVCSTCTSIPKMERVRVRVYCFLSSSFYADCLINTPLQLTKFSARVRACVRVGACTCVCVCVFALVMLSRPYTGVWFRWLLLSATAILCNHKVSASLSNSECMHLIFTALLEALTLHHSISQPRNSQVKLENVKLNQLDTNQGPSACRVDVLPLGHGLAGSHRMETCDFPHLACTCS